MQESTELIQQPSDPVGQEELDIIEMLNGGPEKAEVPAAPEKEQAAAGEEPTTPEKDNVAAEQVPEKDGLDYGLKVPMTGGEPVTLGELKDAYQNRQAAMLELTERENGVLRETEKAQMLLSYVAELPPHIAEAARAQAVQDYQREMQTLVTIVPEARTPEGVNAMRAAIYEMAAEYGVQKRDVDQVKNAVTIKMMYDFARLKRSIRAARDNVKPLRLATPSAARTSINQSEAQVAAAKAKQTRAPGDETNAVAALLRSA